MISRPLKNQAPGKAGLGRVGRLPDPRAPRRFRGTGRRCPGPAGVAAGGRFWAADLRRRPLRRSRHVVAEDGPSRRAPTSIVTGDVKHHDALNALGQGIAVIDAGHHATEKIIVPAMASLSWPRRRLLAGVAVGTILEPVASMPDPFLNVIPGEVGRRRCPDYRHRIAAGESCRGCAKRRA